MKAYIDLEDINFTYKKTRFSIDGLSLKLYGGQTAVITGGNGSGKTTLSKIMMGIIRPDGGAVAVDGRDIKKSRLAETAARIGYLFQNPERQLFCSTALEEIAFSLAHRGESKETAAVKADALLARFSMETKANDFPLKLSRGEKQRLALLAVFAMRPRYYILDEPSAGIDEGNKQKLIEMLGEIEESGAGMCIITHDKELIKLADRVITMDGGRVVRDESA
jgi:energy-coupling factor transport system ATP-binding protein